MIRVIDMGQYVVMSCSLHSWNLGEYVIHPWYLGL